MKNIEVEFQFGDPGFIGQPYWPEKDLLINIGKGVNPKSKDTKRLAALKSSCEKNGITLEQYDEVVERAARPFNTTTGTNDGEIIIPERQFQSFLNHASMMASGAIPKIREKGLTFIAVKVTDRNGLKALTTGMYGKDAVNFDRFVKMETSNQRSFCSSKYIANFTAKGLLIVDEEIISVADLRKLIEWGGKMVGMGGARPQGYGRFQVTSWKVV